MRLRERKKLEAERAALERLKDAAIGAPLRGFYKGKIAALDRQLSEDSQP